MSGPRSGNGQPLISLGSPFSADTAHLPGFQRHGFLAREIVRQALLIAARDELGAVTRDEVLGDPAASAKEGSVIEVCSLFTDESDTPNRAFIRRAEGPKTETLADRTLPSPYLESGGILKLVAAAESLSRTEFPEALKKLGLEGKPHEVRADGALSAGIEDKLSSLDFVEPFAAVRSLHERDPSRRRVAGAARSLDSWLRTARRAQRVSMASGPQGIQGPRPPVRPAALHPRSQEHLGALAPRLRLGAGGAASRGPG